MIDYAALATEISTDPANLGYAAHVSAGHDQSIADLLNLKTGNGAGTISLATLAKNDFLIATSVAVVRLALGVQHDGTTPLTQLVVAKWTAALNHARAADPGSQVNLGVISALGNPVSDGVLTTAEFTAVTTKVGSRSEVLFGSGTAISHSDVAKARGNLG